MPKAQIETKEITHNDSTKNSYRVPVKQWSKWSEHAKGVFNRLYSAMTANQDFFKHPKQRLLSDEVWKTPCWNAAWTAADAVDALKAKE